MRHSKFLACLMGIVLCLGVGIIAGWVTMTEVINWYPTLKQPSFTPPAYVFGPVWTVLYILMGIAAGLVFQTKSANRGKALTCFVVQLFFNALWSFIFFSWHHLGFALLDLGLLWLSLIATIYFFYKTKPLSAYLMLPYLMWSSFAFVINAGVVLLN